MYDSFMGIDLSADGHTTVTWDQLTHWQTCPSWEGFTAGPYTAGTTTISFAHPCDYFTVSGAFGGDRNAGVMKDL